MEDPKARVDQINLTIYSEYLIEGEQVGSELSIVAHIISQTQANVDAPLRVHRKNWTKNRGLDLKVVDQSTFIFYFEEASDLEFVLRKVHGVLIIILWWCRSSL